MPAIIKAIIGLAIAVLLVPILAILAIFGIRTYIASARAGGALETAAETPPPEAPVIAKEEAFHPVYSGAGGNTSAGTAFVTTDRAGGSWLITASHIFEPSEWSSITHVDVRMIGQDRTPGSLSGAPALRGRATSGSHYGQDVVAWQFTDGFHATTLALAQQNPKKNEWVWILGQEAKQKKKPEEAFLCKVTDTSGDALVIVPQSAFDLRAFSGAPVINSAREVVGIVLASLDSGNTKVVINPVANIRTQLASANIQVD